MGELEEEIMRAWHAAMQVWEERHLYEPIKSAPEPEPWRPPATWRATVLGEPGGALSGELRPVAHGSPRHDLRDRQPQSFLGS